jgi:cytochrome c oxidase assembly protein subunit 15
LPLLVVAFGTTVAMWSVGYLGRLPALLLPSPPLLVLLLACVFLGGFLLGRMTGRGWAPGFVAGSLAGLLNLLVLGSFLGGPRPNEVVPSALWWIPGSILIAGSLAAAGATVGRRWPVTGDRPDRWWLGAFAKVAVAATLLLLAVGGLVTSAEAGLAVTDWPNSFGYNMFLYPFSRMTGGVYYEHAHRLFGALVGLTTLMLALLLQRADPRRWVRRLGWLALVLVVTQGILGGLRVTGNLTLSTSAEAMAPNLALAMIHGVLAQLFFALMVALSIFTSATWLAPRRPLERPSAETDRSLGVVLVALVICQLVLGAVQRHFAALLTLHIVFGVALVAPIALHVGIRSWGLNVGQRLLQRLGLGLVGAVVLQVLLGLGAFVATGGAAQNGTVSRTELLFATAHQWFGAVLLALAVALTCWSRRLLSTTTVSPRPELQT